MGQDRMDAARLLQQHSVIVRGGPQEGSKLLDALVVSPSQLGCGLDTCMRTIARPWRGPQACRNHVQKSNISCEPRSLAPGWAR